MQGSRAFYRLRHFNEAPQLPHGYATMFLIALVPPLWFRLMDPLVDAYLAGRQSEPQSQSEASSPSQINAIVG
jgi:alkane 1-monooxygenase